MMKRLAIAVIHYHLRPGGVTRVIERALEALAGAADVVVLSGEAPASDAPLAPITEVCEPLGYAETLPPDPERQIDAVRGAAVRRLGNEPDIWHIHNHALGKNVFTPLLTHRLAQDGCRLLLQPHDFAEDGRPANYRLLRDRLGDDMETLLYPAADHVRYAPINFRDTSFLQQIGLTHVYELPNAVAANTAPAEVDRALRPPRSKTILYPARAIRRKNLGEFLLWSLLAPDGYVFQSTLAPRNPVWQGYYREWVAFARELRLPVEFDAGRTHDFTQLIRDAAALMTTSIAEGFGLAFLEPWLEGRNLIGRKLPEITPDFERAGLDLSGLYDALPVPIEWAGRDLFLERLKAGLRESCTAYGRPYTDSLLDAAVDALILEDRIDFGILDETLQRHVIRHLAAHPGDRDQLPEFGTDAPEGIVAHNRRVVEEGYSLPAYGRRLMALYTGLARSEPGPVTPAPAAQLLDIFLQPGRFNLLRT